MMSRLARAMLSLCGLQADFLKTCLRIDEQSHCWLNPVDQSTQFGWIDRLQFRPLALGIGFIDRVRESAFLRSLPNLLQAQLAPLRSYWNRAWLADRGGIDNDEPRSEGRRVLIGDPDCLVRRNQTCADALLNGHSTPLTRHSHRRAPHVSDTQHLGEKAKR